MKISIIIPLYNKANYLGRALDSVAAQTLTDYEVIVVDDGSTDGGGRLVAARNDSRFRLVVQDNSGPGRARNRGLGEATGEYVAFLDADDEWRPEFLETGVGLMEERGAGVAAVCFGYFDYPPGGSTEPMWRRRGLVDGPYRIDATTPAELAVSLLAYMTPLASVVRTDVVRRWGGFFDRRKCLYGEDSYLWLKVLLNETVDVRLEPLACYHREASALTRRREGPRPVEPLLSDPEEISAACPPELSALLDRILGLRALKTACMLGYWGQWREARFLLKRFCVGMPLRCPWLYPAWVCASPLGPQLGRLWRSVRRTDAVSPPASPRRKARDEAFADGLMTTSRP